MPKTNYSDVGKDLSPEGLLEGYQLAEHENSNLRKHLLWAAQFLNDNQRKELSLRISKPIEDGGVVDDAREEDEIKLRNMYSKVDKICDAFETVLSSRKLPTNTYRLIMTINDIREALPKKFGVTLTGLHQIFPNK